MRATRVRAEEFKASIPIIGIAEEIYASRYEDIGSEVEQNDVGYQNYVIGRRQFRLCIIQASGTIDCILLKDVTVVFGVAQIRIRLVFPLFIKRKTVSGGEVISLLQHVHSLRKTMLFMQPFPSHFINK